MVFKTKQHSKAQIGSTAGACDSDNTSDECNTNSEDSEIFQKASAAKASFKSPEIWMLVFGNVLATCAGMVDAGSILSFGVATTHMSGPTAQTAMSIEDTGYGGGLKKVERTGFVILFFLLGAFLCGLVIPKGQVHLGGKALYGTALICESILLMIAAILPSHYFAPFFAAMASGLQNAMCTMHFGAIVRTTHVTGTLTDIGSTSGRAVIILLKKCFRPSSFSALDEAELHVDGKKLAVLIPIFCSFFIGAFFGAFVCRKLDFNDHALGLASADVLFVPAAVTGFSGLMYTFLREKLKRQFKAFEAERLSRDVERAGMMLDGTKQVLHKLQNARLAQASSVDNDEEDIEAQVQDMLEVLQDVQSTVTDLYHADCIHAADKASASAQP
jgi:uncharacterized membrane protein YoaK (UPF0700 family)